MIDKVVAHHHQVTPRCRTGAAYRARAGRSPARPVPPQPRQERPAGRQAERGAADRDEQETGADQGAWVPRPAHAGLSATSKASSIQRERAAATRARRLNPPPGSLWPRSSSNSENNSSSGSRNAGRRAKDERGHMAASPGVFLHSAMSAAAKLAARRVHPTAATASTVISPSVSNPGNRPGSHSRCSARALPARSAERSTSRSPGDVPPRWPSAPCGHQRADHHRQQRIAQRAASALEMRGRFRQVIEHQYEQDHRQCLNEELRHRHVGAPNRTKTSATP